MEIMSQGPLKVVEIFCAWKKYLFKVFKFNLAKKSEEL